MLSSNSFIMSQGPSPTPTNTMDKGNSLQTKDKLKQSEVFLTQEARKIMKHDDVIAVSKCQDTISVRVF